MGSQQLGVLTLKRKKIFYYRLRHGMICNKFTTILYMEGMNMNCTNCGAAIAPDAKFCVVCGMRMEESTPPPPPMPAEQPQQYVPQPPPVEQSHQYAPPPPPVEQSQQYAPPPPPVKPPQQYAPPPQQYAPPPYAPPAMPNSDPKSAPLSTGKFMLMDLFLVVPFIGILLSSVGSLFFVFTSSITSLVFTIISICLPIFTLIMYFVWAFGNFNKNTKSWARSKLIWLLIGVIMSIVLLILSLTVLKGWIGNLGSPF